jgi:hypothetical protein
LTEITRDIKISHSYIDYLENHVLLRDEHIVWLMEVIVRDNALDQMPPGLGSLFVWWKGKRDTFGPGCIELPLDEFLRDLESAGMLIDILESLASKLRKAGPIVHGEEINDTVRSSRFVYDDQSTESLCKVIDKVKSLVESGRQTNSC